jgi:hypothetical protein
MDGISVRQSAPGRGRVVAPVLAGSRATFRAVVEAVAPDARDMDEAAWREAETIVETVLAARPEKLRRQLATFLRVIRWWPLFRYGHRFDALDPRRRVAVLDRFEHSRVLLLRRGFWGLRTLGLMGVYGRRDAAAAIGYRARKEGWEALSGRSESSR